MEDLYGGYIGQLDEAAEHEAGVGLGVVGLGWVGFGGVGLGYVFGVDWVFFGWLGLAQLILGRVGLGWASPQRPSLGSSR